MEDWISLSTIVEVLIFKMGRLKLSFAVHTSTTLKLPTGTETVFNIQPKSLIQVGSWDFCNNTIMPGRMFCLLNNHLLRWVCQTISLPSLLSDLDEFSSSLPLIQIIVFVIGLELSYSWIHYGVIQILFSGVNSKSIYLQT